MCLHWLKYVMLDAKDRLKNMCGMTLKSRHASRRQRVPHCDFECLPMCDWVPLT